MVRALVATSMLVSAPAPPGDWTTALEKVVHADVTQSVTLPGGDVLWVFGDTTRVNGVSTVGPWGYPHSAFARQTAGTLNFTAIPGPYGYGWQQVPNWSDGTYFWMSTPIVDNGTLYVIGERIRGVSPFTVVGPYVAVFDASTLAFQRIVALPAGATGTTMWGGVARTATGWWLTGTHPVAGKSVGDMAFVPFGRLADGTRWTVHDNVIPSSTEIGVVLALHRTATGWEIFTKRGDAYGGTQIERLTARTVLGTWTVNGLWDAPSPPGTITYAVAVHPEQTAPAGQVLVSYNVNGNEADYYPRFLYLPGVARQTLE
ncbi:hypothetical protein [Paractinoplanes atraurantiacus]|uniref:hypothetical protein n=1 Tax=Paractinoplanes atraurantiacus TaxID=1036182 RepID=UPI001177DF6B|nr:hypothetical protein [Actinoplanes atraurantiacus]